MVRATYPGYWSTIVALVIISRERQVIDLAQPRSTIATPTGYNREVGIGKGRE
jgi:hypothetical protein